MDEFSAKQEQRIIELTLKNLAEHNINGFFVKDRSELLLLLSDLITDGSNVCSGGSMTLRELSIESFLNDNNCNYRVGPDSYHDAFNADTYLMSSNAITMDGSIINMDGRCNRVAALLYGPKQVLIIVGKNKLVKDEAAAITRLEMVAAPANAMRLGCNTPCAISGKCEHCNSKNKICRAYVKLSSQIDSNRIKVIIVNESLGY
ncbi:MAG: lactate utilization protein [Erysipelotrichaceae bacterium]